MCDILNDNMCFAIMRKLIESQVRCNNTSPAISHLLTLDIETSNNEKSRFS